MPTLRKDRGNAWLARVVINGETVDSKFFPPGRINGPEWMAAKTWEVERKKELLQDRAKKQKTPLASEIFLAWGEQYLDYAERIMSHSTFIEKRTVMQDFFAFCQKVGIRSLNRLTKPVFYRFLTRVADERGAKRANVYRKNLLSAWNWGIEGIDGFPQVECPLFRIKPFPADSMDRYVPPEEDVIKVMSLTHGQDLVMLLTFYYTGARRGEVFRLLWDDVRLEEARIRLKDHKARTGTQRVRWLQMHPELLKAFLWWKEARPCMVDNVFMQMHCKEHMGKPFTQRMHFMRRLCERAGVRPFGFHAMRHKAAAITFLSGGLQAAQTLMGHSRATTTDRYVKSAGLYADQDVILNALGESGIGKAVSELLEKEMPHRAESCEAFCNQNFVTNKVR